MQRRTPGASLLDETATRGTIEEERARVLRKRFSLALVLSVAVAGAAYAGSIVGSDHDMTAIGKTRQHAGDFFNDYQEICVYCHTPHGADPAAPLWNRDMYQGNEGSMFVPVEKDARDVEIKDLVDRIGSTERYLSAASIKGENRATLEEALKRDKEKLKTLQDNDPDAQIKAKSWRRT